MELNSARRLRPLAIEPQVDAPGAPGVPPRWTSSAKAGIGTAPGSKSHVWFTHSHGILNEVYYPDVDQACIRDLGLLVTDGRNFFSDEKRNTRSQVTNLAPGVPAFRLTNTCVQGRYRIEKDLIADPVRDVILQRIQFVPLHGTLEDFHLFVLLAPHLGNQGDGNTAWVDSLHNLLMLAAQRGDVALALACSEPWLKRSVGFVGTSDGWQDVVYHKEMIWEYEHAANGNVAMIGEVDLKKTGGSFVLALSFGRDALEAGAGASKSLKRGFGPALSQYIKGWQLWQKNHKRSPDDVLASSHSFEASMSVLKCSESKLHAGGLIASLSFPWGFARGDDDLGGYHLVWPRDLVEAAGALLAGGAYNDAVNVLDYLHATQLPDGHWPQNMWIDGKPYWQGIQMDETAFPILLMDQAYREGVLRRKDQSRYWQMVRQAATYLIVNGPVTQEDRWEEDPGYSPFTLAVEIAALLAAADLAECNDEVQLAGYLRETADSWNSNIEKWTYVQNTDLAREVGVDGYYVRIAPPETAEASSLAKGFIPIKNRPPGQSTAPAVHIISPDALALVRFGIRAPDDSRIVNTVRVIDALLRVNAPGGPAWHRYNDDGYGEHDDGSPYDGTGIGRLWPLLTGERAHYELAAGRRVAAQRLLGAMESFANEGGMIPEQIWDAHDLPDRELFFGKAAGSAMPLVWAHAEHVKLHRSLRDNKVYDTLPQPVRRYLFEHHDPAFAVWRFSHKCSSIPCGKVLRIEVLEPATIRWSADDWASVHDLQTQDTGIGLHMAELPVSTLPSGSSVGFTFFWKASATWEGTNFSVALGS